MKIFSKLLLIGTLLVLTTAMGPRIGIRRVKQGIWNYGSDKDNTALVLFASFAGGLPSNGYLKLSLSADANWGDSEMKLATFQLAGTTDVPDNLGTAYKCTDEG